MRPVYFFHYLGKRSRSKFQAMKKVLFTAITLLFGPFLSGQHIIDLLNCDQEIPLIGDIRSITHKKINLYPNEGVHTWDLMFDKDNQLVRERAVEFSGELRHQYNEAGQLMTTVRKVKSNRMDSILFEYDAQGRLYRKISFGTQESPQTIYQFNYDSLGRVLLVEAKDQSNRFRQSVEYLDSSSQVIITHAQGPNSRRLLFPFDTQKQCINRMTREVKNVQGQVIMQEMIRFSTKASNQNSILHEYRYDEEGNWTWHRQSDYQNGIKTPTTLWIRKIKYR